MSAVYGKSFPPPPVDRRELLRYAGAGAETEALGGLIDSCLEEALGRLTYQVCWARFPVARKGAGLDLGFAATESADLQRNLAGCGEIVLFAATVGMEMDRMIARANRISPARALILQALGSERAESLCDAFEREIRAEAAACGKTTRPRYSPGYGDLLLDFQRAVFRALEPEKRIGVVLNGSLLMSPSKSVTAMIGIEG